VNLNPTVEVDVGQRRGCTPTDSSELLDLVHSSTIKSTVAFKFRFKSTSTTLVS